MWLNRPVRIIYFSPHLDDAVLSAGGLIRSQTDAGIPVEVWTFMSGIPDNQELSEFAQYLHNMWGLGTPQEAVKARRAEDDQATARVGAKAVRFDFLDCIYRRGRLGQALYSDVEVPMAPEDADLAAQIAQAMIAWLQPDDMVVCQLAIGRHIDHVIVRQAAEMLRRPLTYDADIPYLLNHPDELQPNVLGMREALQPVSRANLQCWLAAIECYASQISSVFGSLELAHQRMEDFWSEQHGVRFWTRQSPG